MRVFKFGGASVKDADAVKNVATILNANKSSEQLCVVVSAMGKTTNLLEEIAKKYFNHQDFHGSVSLLKEYHFSIAKDLFKKNHPFFDELHNIFVELEWILEDEPVKEYEYIYDQIVSLGEILSTKIIATYLLDIDIDCIWADVRDFLKTDNNYREGKVDWLTTSDATKDYFNKHKNNVVITQGFIGGTSENYTTTLGREGSDYSAAILAYCLNAKEVTIWKDVPGVLNADPKYFDNTFVLEHLSYQDTIELAFYGATVIHPKTIKPLQNKGITLRVRSFVDPMLKGTIIDGSPDTQHKPSFIIKRNQVLVSIFPKDFSFIVEDNLSDIFSLFSSKQVKINLMQNSAISFSVCINNDENKIQEILPILKESFKVLFNENLKLITIRYYDNTTEKKILDGKERILEQRSRHTLQVVIKE